MTTPHIWIPSTLGHGDQMCENCRCTMLEASALGEMNECDGPAQATEAAPETPNPQHEPEVEEKKAVELYTSIIDMLNKEHAISMGSKVKVLAQVLTSISRSIGSQTPGDEDNVITFFLTVLAHLDTMEATPKKNTP